MIVLKLQGGLGNQMFQYALGRTLSLKYNQDLKLDLRFLLDRTPREEFVFRDYDLSIFDLKVSFLKKSDIIAIVKQAHQINSDSWDCFRVHYETSFSFNKVVLEYKNAYFDGYWQSPQYFNGFEHILREDFRFKNKVFKRSNKLVNTIVGSNSVCLNVRRSDFVYSKSANDFHGVITENYFLECLNNLSIKKNNLHIFVFSDDLLWCKTHLKFDFPTYYIGYEHAGNKFSNYLQLMTLCKYFIIPNSTFGWWAAWLSCYSEKIVYAPTNWFKNSNVNTDDLFPTDWIRM